jgi:hypothetical protein
LHVAPSLKELGPITEITPGTENMRRSQSLDFEIETGFLNQQMEIFLHDFWISTSISGILVLVSFLGPFSCISTVQRMEKKGQTSLSDLLPPFEILFLLPSKWLSCPDPCSERIVSTSLKLTMTYAL